MASPNDWGDQPANDWGDRPAPATGAPDKPGYLETLGSDLSQIPGAAKYAAAHPLATTAAGAHRSFQALGDAWQALKAGRTEEAYQHFESAIPFIGPMAVAVQQDLENGNTARAAARVTEFAAPEIARVGPPVV